MTYRWSTFNVVDVLRRLATVYITPDAEPAVPAVVFIMHPYRRHYAENTCMYGTHRHIKCNCLNGRFPAVCEGYLRCWPCRDLLQVSRWTWREPWSSIGVHACAVLLLAHCPSRRPANNQSTESRTVVSIVVINWHCASYFTWNGIMFWLVSITETIVTSCDDDICVVSKTWNWGQFSVDVRR